VALVAAGGYDHCAVVERLTAAEHLHQRVEHAQVAAVGLQRNRSGKVGRPPVLVDQALDQAGKVEAQGHRDHVGALVGCPLDAAE
jgi:hypothetical protein